MGVFSLTGWSRRIRAGFLVSRVTQDTTKPYHASHTGLSPSMDELSRSFRSHSMYYNVVLQPRRCVATTPVWALPRSLATTGGIVFTFSSCGYLDVSVPRVGLPLCGIPESLPVSCLIRISADQRVFAPPRGFSQLITSFVASESQGILHAPFSCLVLSVSDCPPCSLSCLSCGRPGPVRRQPCVS